MKMQQQLHDRSGRQMEARAQVTFGRGETGTLAGVPPSEQSDLLEFESANLRRNFAAFGVNRTLGIGSNEVRLQRREAGAGQLAGMMGVRQKNFDLIKAQYGATTNIELRAGPGGEMQAAERLREIRKAAIAEKRDATGNLYRFISESQQNELNHQIKLAEIEHSRIDSLKHSIGGLIDAAFAGGKGMLDSLKRITEGIFLAPLKEGLSSVLATKLYPVLYGQDGKSGVMGGAYKLFGGGVGGGIGDVKLHNGAVPVVVVNVPGGTAAAGSGGVMGSWIPRGLPRGLAGGLFAMGMAGASGSPLDMAGSPRFGVDSSFNPISEGGYGGTSPMIPGMPGNIPFEAFMAPNLMSNTAGAVMPSGGDLPYSGTYDSGFNPWAAFATGGGSAAGTAARFNGAALGRGAAAVGGMALFQAGLKRDGFTGDAMTIGGAAGTGFGYGGPIGAGIGATVGTAIAGFRSRDTARGQLELFTIGPEWAIAAKLGWLGKPKIAELHDSIKSQYGVDIPRGSGTLKQLLQIVEQSFGSFISRLAFGRSRFEKSSPFMENLPARRMNSRYCRAAYLKLAGSYFSRRLCSL